MCNKLSYLFSFVLVLGLIAGVASGLDIKVNFMQQGGDIPPGYFPDYGLPFGPQGDSPFQYGWDRDITADARNRGSANALDERYDTLVHLQKGAPAIWEIELPNGAYEMHLVGGDPDYTDQTNNFDVEGVIVEDPDGQAGAGFDFDEWDLTAVVADGRLTIQPAEGAANSKIMWVDIVGVELLKAYSPDPKDGALLEDTWVTLSWTAGETAVSHDVYLGDNLDDVSNGTPDSDIFRGNQITTFYVAGFPGFAYPEGLAPGTTYYWRIDEVETDGTTIHKGDIWSFSIPPKTAYNPDPADNAEGVGPDDVRLSWTAGYGAKLHTVYIGNDYDEVSNATGGMVQGTTTYNAGTLEAEKVYYWRVDEFDAVQTYKGDIWTFTTPGAVGGPKPADRATGVAMTTSLSWTAATSATSHELYFGLDKEAVRSADSSSPEYQGNVALGSESYDPGKLAWETMYFWRVDAVTNAGPVKGPIWSFTTADFIAVDDFESYTDNDVAGEAIWQSWIDGFGVADNGAQAGYLVPPYAEQTIVHGGLQSMPLMYTNEAGVTNSEATLTLTTRDWTEEGVAELSLWFYGSPQNAPEPLYLTVANNAGTPATLANEDPEAAIKGSWAQWVIPLQTIADQGISLTDVDKISIGLGSKSGMAVVGGTGTMYIDDIALYR